jgi:hypothetical protein
VDGGLLMMSQPSSSKASCTGGASRPTWCDTQSENAGRTCRPFLANFETVSHPESLQPLLLATTGLTLVGATEVLLKLLECTLTSCVCTCNVG